MPPVRTRLTWDQFTRRAKFVVGMGWATCELALWGGRLYPLVFIAAVIAGTEGAELRGLLKKMLGDS